MILPAAEFEVQDDSAYICAALVERFTLGPLSLEDRPIVMGLEAQDRKSM